MASPRDGYKRAEYLTLTNGHLHAVAWGTVDWVMRNGSWTARLPVEADGYPDGMLALNLKVNEFRPDQPTAALLWARHCAVRLDVNGDHGAGGKDAVRGVTHLQIDDDCSGRYVFKECPEAPRIDGAQAIQAWHYRDVLWWFADYLNIDRAGVQWADPEWLEEGRR